MFLELDPYIWRQSVQCTACASGAIEKKSGGQRAYILEKEVEDAEAVLKNTSCRMRSWSDDERNEGRVMKMYELGQQ